MFDNINFFEIFFFLSFILQNRTPKWDTTKKSQRWLEGLVWRKIFKNKSSDWNEKFLEKVRMEFIKIFTDFYVQRILISFQLLIHCNSPFKLFPKFEGYSKCIWDYQNENEWNDMLCEVVNLKSKSHHYQSSRDDVIMRSFLFMALMMQRYIPSFIFMDRRWTSQ